MTPYAGRDMRALARRFNARHAAGSSGQMEINHDIVKRRERYAAPAVASSAGNGGEGDTAMRGHGRSGLAGLAVAQLAVALIFANLGVISGVPGARAAAPDIIVYGDPTLAHALRAVGARFSAQTGVPVHVFSAPPAVILAQLRHEVWNDVVVTLVPWMDRAEQAGVIEPGTRTGAWRTTLVMARATDPAPSGVTPANDTVAITDPTPAATIDGPAVLAALGLHPAHVQGVANAAEVAFLLDTGAAAQGLVHLTDVRADPQLSVSAPVADTAYSPIVYAAAISTLTHSPNARAFLDYLHSPAATEVLHAAGLEAAPLPTAPEDTRPVETKSQETKPRETKPREIKP
jgi:molybdate transport system substrate-binding protein